MKIANKISLSFLAVSIILTGTALPFFYFIAKQSLEKSIYHNLTTAVTSRTSHIETYLKMLKISVGQLSKSPVLENFLKISTEKNSEWDYAFNTAVKRLKRTKEANPAVAEFLLLDRAGKVVVSSRENSIGLDRSADGYFLGGQKTAYIKDVYYSEIYKELSIDASAPFLDSQTGELLGVLVARVGLNDLDRIMTNRVGLGETGEIYIVNKYGYMVTPSRFKEGVVLKQKVDSENARRARLLKDREGASSQEETLNIYADYRGVSVLGAYEFIPEMQWSVLAEEDAAEVFRPLIKLRIAFLFILFFVPVVAWLLGVFISKLITKPLEKLRKGTEIIGRGDLYYKVGIDARDEIGELSREFDKMTENLRNTTSSIKNLNSEMMERRRAEERIRKLNELQASLLDSDVLEEKLTKITEGVIGIFDADFVRIWMMGPPDRCNSGCVHASVKEGPHMCQFRDRCLHLVASSGRYTHIDGGAHARVPFGAYKIGKIASGEYPSFLTNDVTHDAHVHNHEWAKELGLVSFAGFQLRPPHGKTIGVLALFSRHIISPEEYMLLENISNLIARTIQMEQVEEAVRENEEKFRVLFTSSADAVMILKPPSWKFIFCNPSAVKIFRVKNEDEFVSLGPWDVSPEKQPDGRVSGEKAREMIEIAMREGSNYFEWMHKRLNGEDFPATVLLNKVVLGNEVMLQATVRDVTNEKKYEQQLLSDRNEIKKKSEALNDALKGSLKSREILSSMLEDNNQIRQKLEASIEEGKKNQQMLVQSEKLASIGQLAAGVAHEINNPVGFVGSNLSTLEKYMNDITEIFRAVELLKGAVEQNNLDQAVVARNEIIQLEKDIDLDYVFSDIDNLIRESKEGVDRIKNIVRDLKTFSRTDEGSRSMANLNQILDGIINIVWNEIKYKIELKKDYGNIPLVECNTQQIGQVFINILINAAQAISDKGIIAIHTFEENGQVCVDISDTGCGIPAATLNKLFEPFFTTKEAGKGTGLGLSISLEIVKKHKGTIHVESEVGKGSHLIVKLPAACSGKEATKE
jgi:PAS domain S-box-containing protein